MGSMSSVWPQTASGGGRHDSQPILSRGAENLVQLHFERQISDPQHFASELAETVCLRNGVGAPEFRIQKPDLGGAFGDVTIAAALYVSEPFVPNDLDPHER